MTIKTRFVRGLLRIYPASWRSEYGEELETVLLTRRLTALAALDVARGGVAQRLRRDAPWKICAAVLLAWTIAGMIRSYAGPAPASDFQAICGVAQAILLVCGFWTAFRGPGGIGAGAISAVKAMWVGIVPDLLLMLVWATGLGHPSIVGQSLATASGGHELALLYVRGVLLGDNLLATACIELLAAAVAGGFLGAVGGTAGRAARRVQARFRPA
jgi:hypothetical protein